MTLVETTGGVGLGDERVESQQEADPDYHHREEEETTGNIRGVARPRTLPWRCRQRPASPRLGAASDTVETNAEL